MNFIRKILGLGPKELVNKIPRKPSSQIKRLASPEEKINEQNIFPVLVTKRTREVELADQITSVFHTREGAFNDVLIALASFDYQNLNQDQEADVFQIMPKEEDAFLHFLVEHAEKNIEKLDFTFQDWNPSDEKFSFKILSASISFFTSELIMSKKHMLLAHKLLNSKELFVSIPRRGLIFICDKNLNEEDYMAFLNMHAYLVLKEDEKTELLCEDVFVLENGEITNVLEMHQLSEILQK